MEKEFFGTHKGTGRLQHHLESWHPLPGCVCAICQSTQNTWSGSVVVTYTSGDLYAECGSDGP
ncbi:hypothetical protein IG631_24052 [Alternaria alternata]|nr:hypothetical protein IG631_24052 [Alternaria alternata]